MLSDPKTAQGFASWALLGFGGAIVALLLSYLFPSVIPARAAGVKL